MRAASLIFSLVLTRLTVICAEEQKTTVITAGAVIPASADVTKHILSFKNVLKLLGMNAQITGDGHSVGSERTIVIGDVVGVEVLEAAGEYGYSYSLDFEKSKNIEKFFAGDVISDHLGTVAVVAVDDNTSALTYTVAFKSSNPAGTAALIKPMVDGIVAGVKASVAKGPQLISLTTSKVIPAPVEITRNLLAYDKTPKYMGASNSTTSNGENVGSERIMTFGDTVAITVLTSIGEHGYSYSLACDDRCQNLDAFLPPKYAFDHHLATVVVTAVDEHTSVAAYSSAFKSWFQEEVGAIFKGLQRAILGGLEADITKSKQEL